MYSGEVNANMQWHNSNQTLWNICKKNFVVSIIGDRASVILAVPHTRHMMAPYRVEYPFRNICTWGSSNARLEADFGNWVQMLPMLHAQIIRRGAVQQVKASSSLSFSSLTWRRFGCHLQSDFCAFYLAPLHPTVFSQHRSQPQSTSSTQFCIHLIKSYFISFPTHRVLHWSHFLSTPRKLMLKISHNTNYVLKQKFHFWFTVTSLT